MYSYFRHLLCQSPLEFKIHLQAYIELCRERKLAEAIAYVKKNLSPAAVAELATAPATADGSNQTDNGQAGTMMAELSQAMALLAYAPDTVEHILVYKVRWRRRELFSTRAHLQLF